MRCLSPVLYLAMLTLIGSPVLAAEGSEGSSEKPVCRQAEVNPVTGHALCIDPLGAEVSAPPPSAEQNCDQLAGGEHQGQWTFGPKCKDRPSG